MRRIAKSQAKAAGTGRGRGCNLSWGFWKSQGAHHVITIMPIRRKGISEVNSFVRSVLAACHEAGGLHWSALMYF